MNTEYLLNTSIDDLSFAVVDVETTGMFAQHNRIMDIGVVIVSGGKITQKWETLIDPQQKIPYWITTFTNIRGHQVKGKPLFDQVAPKISSLLTDTIFVAHNVSFDYSFVQAEMQKAKHDFDFPRLCTVQLGRKLLPTLPGANLDVLSKYFEINISARHRALPDAEATALILLEYIKIAKDKYHAKSFFDLERLQRIKVQPKEFNSSARQTLF